MGNRRLRSYRQIDHKFVAIPTLKQLSKLPSNGGIRFFDTAQQYQNGGSEAKYGRFLTPKYRDHIFLMTKTLARDFSAARRGIWKNRYAG
jgi:aryl-alcohol dehydrogenase-like predicted oxidoreductase